MQLKNPAFIADGSGWEGFEDNLIWAAKEHMPPEPTPQGISPQRATAAPPTKELPCVFFSDDSGAT